MRRGLEDKLEKLVDMQLDEENSKTEALQAKIEELENQLDYHNWSWMRHIKIEDEGIDVPRLEMRYVSREKGNWYHYDVLYSMVYRHFLGHFVMVPLGTTKIGHGGGLLLSGGKLHLPFREGAHFRSDSDQLRLPMFTIVEPDGVEIKEKLIEKVEPGQNTN